MTVADRATIANMAPESWRDVRFLPDRPANDRLSDDHQAAIPSGRARKAYAEAQGMWRTADTPDPVFTDSLQLDMTDVVPSLRDRKRPQDRVHAIPRRARFSCHGPGIPPKRRRWTNGMRRRRGFRSRHGDVCDRGDYIVHEYVEPQRHAWPPAWLARNAVARG